MAKLMYENRFILTRKLHKEYFRFLFLTLQKKTRLAALLLAVAAFLLSGVLLFGLHSKAGAAIGLVFTAYFVYMFFYGYVFREWLQYRKLQDEHGKAIVNIVKFNSDQVQVQVNKTSFSFKYSTIEQAYETEELIILILQKEGMAAHGQPLYKKSFGGQESLEAFQKYLNQKTGAELFTDANVADTA